MPGGPHAVGHLLRQPVVQPQVQIQAEEAAAALRLALVPLAETLAALEILHLPASTGLAVPVDQRGRTAVLDFKAWLTSCGSTKKIEMKKLIFWLAACLLWCEPSLAASHGIAFSSSFNGGKFQLNTNFAGIGGDYPLLNYFQNTSGNWALRDNSGSPAPSDLDQFGYPVNGSNALVSHSGVFASVRIPAQVYVGNNCPAGTSGVGICFSLRVNGIGTLVNPGTIINSSSAIATVTPGTTTTITFSVVQDFRAGMEVPISGTTGVTATNGGGGNLTGGGTAGAWTVCAANLTPITIQLCLSDQVTPLTTTGTAGGTTVVTYGRNAVGVTTKGRVVSQITGGLISVSLGISAQDATTPITYRNPIGGRFTGVPGIAMVLEGSEEVRYEAGQLFGANFLSVLNSGKPAVLRALDYINTNFSAEVNWADRMPIGYYSYGSDQFDRRGSTVYGGTTTSTLNDYSITSGSGAPFDGQQISLGFDAASVTVASGANALVTWGAHGLSTGTPIYFASAFGGSVPGGVTGPVVGGHATAAGGVPAGYVYFAITSCGGCDANHIQFATTIANALGGTAVTTTSTGTNVLAHSTVIAATVTLTSGNPLIAWPNHLLNNNDPVSLTGSFGFPLNQEISYFAVTTCGSCDSGHIEISSTSGGGNVVTPQNSGSFGAVRNPTLILNGTTAVAIHGILGTGVGTTRDEQPVARASSSQVYGTLTYDAVLNIWVKRGGDISLGTSFFTSGWPPELFLELCNEVGAHPWFTTPEFVVDTSAGITNYATSLFAFVHTNSPSWMIPRFEITPNEFWNNVFPATSLQTGHAVVYAGNAGWSQNSGTMQIAGKIASVMGQALHNEYGVTLDGTKYQASVGVQTFNFSSASGPTSNAPRLSSTDYIAQTTPAQSPYTKSAAFNWVTHVNCAQYFTPGYYGTTEGTTLAAANAGGVITGSIVAGTATLNVTNVRVVTSPVFGIGSVLTEGPGVQPGTTIIGGTSPNWTLDRTYSNPVGSTNIDYQASGADPTAAQTFIDSSMVDGAATATITGTSMVVTGASGFLFASSGNGGDFIFGQGVQPFTQIVSAPAGNQNGTYTITPSQNVGPIMISAAGAFSLPSEKVMYTAIFAFAQSFTNRDGFALRMNGYEGGYSPDYVSGGLSLTDQLGAQGKLTISSPGSANGIQGYAAQNCINFKNAGGEFCSLFQFTGISPSNNAWSALEDIYQPGPTPVWDAYINLQFLLKRDLDPASNDNDPAWLDKAA
jgi:hypothetical protein